MCESRCFFPFVNFIKSPFGNSNSVSNKFKKEFYFKIYAKNGDQFIDESKNPLELKYLKKIFGNNINKNNVFSFSCNNV